MNNFIYDLYRKLPNNRRFQLRNFLNNSIFFKKYYQTYRKNKIINNKKLTDLIIYTNNFCNAHCGYCDVTRVDVETQSALGIGRPLVGTPVYMSTNLFKKIMEDDFTKKNKLFVNFLMTEPLLSKNIGELLQISKSYEHSTKVTTNGFLLEKRSQEIYKNLDYLQVSLDGPKDLHDSVRGKNFFDRATNGMKIIQNLSPKINISINVTITSVNYKYLYEFLQILDDLKINLSEVRYQFIDFVSEQMSKMQSECSPKIPQSISTIDEVDYLDLDIEKLSEQLEMIKTFKSKNIKKITFKPNMFDKDNLYNYFKKSGKQMGLNNMCSTPYNQLAINTSGNIYWHMRCFNDYVLGNINNNSLSEIWENEKSSHFRKEFEKNDLCFPACTRCCGIMESQEININKNSDFSKRL